MLTTPATLLTELSGVTVDGKPVRAPSAARLFRFYKPQGVLTAANDPKGRPTIYDRLPPGLPRLMPVGRLDFMTEGLLLLTNDGGLKRELELPSTGVVRHYRARAFGAVTQDQLERLAEGVTIEGIRYGSIDANLERRTGRNCWIDMSLTEGKNREVRRVLALPRLAGVAPDPHRLRPVRRHRASSRDKSRRSTATRWRHSATLSNEDHRRPLARAETRHARGAGNAPDRRPGARDPVLDAREPARLVRGPARR